MVLMYYISIAPGKTCLCNKKEKCPGVIPLFFSLDNPLIEAACLIYIIYGVKSMDSNNFL